LVCSAKSAIVIPNATASQRVDKVSDQSINRLGDDFLKALAEEVTVCPRETLRSVKASYRRREITSDLPSLLKGNRGSATYLARRKTRIAINQSANSDYH